MTVRSKCPSSVLARQILTTPRPVQIDYKLVLVFSTFPKSNVLRLQLLETQRRMHILWYKIDVLKWLSARLSCPWRVGITVLNFLDLESSCLIKIWVGTSCLLRLGPYATVCYVARNFCASLIYFIGLRVGASTLQMSISWACGERDGSRCRYAYT